MPHKPSPLELFSRPTATRLEFRQPRQYRDEDGQWQTDSPRSQSLEGGTVVAVGLCALAFAAASIRRTGKEKRVIRELWEKGTTIASLRRLADRGKTLPETVLVRGQIQAKGPPVTSIASQVLHIQYANRLMPYTDSATYCSKGRIRHTHGHALSHSANRHIAPQVPQLRSLIGTIEQPQNIFVEAGKEVKSGKLKLSKGFENLADEVEAFDDDFSHRNSEMGDNLVINELFVTRLGCDARKEQTKDSKGNVRTKITRNPRSTRCNVLHHRSVSDGLHIGDIQTRHSTNDTYIQRHA